MNFSLRARIVEYITKDCPSCAKVVITVAPEIVYSAATGSGAQVVVLAVGAEQESQNSGKPAGLALGPPRGHHDNDFGA